MVPNHPSKTSKVCKKAQSSKLTKRLKPWPYKASPKGLREHKIVTRQVQTRPKTSSKLANTS